MLKFLRSILEHYRSRAYVKITLPQLHRSDKVLTTMTKEKLDLARLGQAVSYNTSNVPLFAPNGFPTWSGVESACNTEEFAYEVARVQQHLGLDAVDGFCGPATINAMADEDRKDHNSILIGPKAYSVSNHVITYLDDPEVSGLPGRRRTQKIRQLCLHYDVTFNSESTLTILRSRGLSYNFLIDGDPEATVYQTHNPTLTACFHAGSINNYSVGLCINNPADPKYQDRDEANRGRKREKKTDVVHGATIERLDFFNEQLAITRELVTILCDVLGIPEDVPRDADSGSIIKGVVPNFEQFNGILGHYHVSRTKTDPSPLDWSSFMNKD